MQRSVWGTASLGAFSLGAFSLGALVGLLLIGGGAQAQVPPPSPEASEIAACLCVQQEMGVLRNQSMQRQGAYDALRSDLSRLDADLARERSRMDVNNPDAVARFRALLERRDAVYRRSIGPVANDAIAAAGRYNAKIDEYNARCANRPRDAALLARVQATLSCPPVY